MVNGIDPFNRMASFYPGQIDITTGLKGGRKMKRLCTAVGTILGIVLFLAQTAFSWGWAVHAYIDDQFSTKWALRNGNRIYGGLAPDLFNFRFDAPEYRAYLFYQTHNNFMNVWDAARSTPGRAVAFGFVSHNEDWGVDSTAHRSGITFGTGEGYVIAKAKVLKGILDQVPQFTALQLPEPVVLEVAHELVERGVDILMKGMDPLIGAKMATAALPPNPDFIPLLERSYAEGLAARFGIRDTDARRFIASSERQFRQMMVLYGQALMTDAATAILLNAEQLEEVAKMFLAAYGLPPLPEGVDIKPLLQFGIEQGMAICAQDFTGEVSATLELVEQQLAARGIAP
jgi:hypothetical protein